MSKSKMSMYDVAIVRGAWIITPEYKAKLDHFFLLHDTWDKLSEDIYCDTQELKRYLKHDGREYEVILMQPYRQIAAAKKLGLSFRVNSASGLRVVLVREWHEAVDNHTEEGIING